MRNVTTVYELLETINVIKNEIIANEKARKDLLNSFYGISLDYVPYMPSEDSFKHHLVEELGSRFDEILNNVIERMRKRVVFLQDGAEKELAELTQQLKDLRSELEK